MWNDWKPAEKSSRLNIQFSQLTIHLVEIGTCIGLLAILIAIYFLLPTVLKHHKFNVAIEEGTSTESEFRVSRDNLKSTIWDRTHPTNDAHDWATISRMWMDSGASVDRAYSAAAKCLKEDTCSIGVTSGNYCGDAESISKSFEDDLERLKFMQSATKITINRPTEHILSPVGSNIVDVPQLSNLPVVVDHCKAQGA